MRDKIMAMDTGSELDRLVAEKVMGWEYKVMHGYKENCFEINKAECEIRFISDFKPSTEVSAAFEVIEKLRPKYMIYLMFGTDKGVTCKIREDGRSAVVGKSYSDTAPEAICKCALLAVMNP